MHTVKQILFVPLLFIAGSAIADPLLVISIDGLHPDYVTKADQYHLKIPVLRHFVREGTFASGVVGVLPTVTYPSHTTLMTGVAPLNHGISSNTTFDPLGINREGWYWYASDIKSPTLWAAARQAQLVTAAVNWPVTAGDLNIDYVVPEYWRASTNDDLKLIRLLSRPNGLLESYEKQLGPYVDGDTNTVEADRIRTRLAVKLIADKHPVLMAIHLASFDETEHEDGPFQPTAFANLEALDAMIGDLQNAARNANPRTVVAIVSDHGFRSVQSTVNLRVPFVSAGLIKLKSAAPNKPPSIASWEAQIWPSGGSAAIVLRDRKDEKVRRQMEALLTQLKSDSRNGIARILSGEEAHRRGGFPEADWVVECAADYYIGSALEGDFVTHAQLKGMHGYAPDQAAMHASFFMEGAGVGKHALNVIDMRQLAPTFAKILGVKLPSATLQSVSYE